MAAGGRLGLAGAQAARPWPACGSEEDRSEARTGHVAETIWILEVLVESGCLARLMVVFCEARCVASCAGVKASSEFEIAVLFVEVSGNRFAPRDVFVDLGHCRQSCGRAVRLSDRDGTVEPDDRGVGEPE